MGKDRKITLVPKDRKKDMSCLQWFIQSGTGIGTAFVRSFYFNRGWIYYYY